MENNMLSLDKKLEQWEKTLPKDKLMLIAYAIKMETDNLVKNIDLNIENCMGAAISDFTNFSIKQIKEIIRKSNEYMDDTSKFIKENGAGYMSKIEKIEGEVKEFLRKEMAAGTLKSEAMAKAKKKFNIPAKDISNMWLIVKEEYFPELCNNRGVSVDQSLKVHEERKKKAVESQNKAHTEEKEVKGTNSQENKEKNSEKARDTKKEEIKTNLVEITEVRKFKGQYGEYEKSKDGIKAGNENFNSVEEIEAYKVIIDKELEEERKTFEKQQAEKRCKALGRLNEVMELLSM